MEHRSEDESKEDAFDRVWDLADPRGLVVVEKVFQRPYPDEVACSVSIRTGSAAPPSFRLSVVLEGGDPEDETAWAGAMVWASSKLGAEILARFQLGAAGGVQGGGGDAASVAAHWLSGAAGSTPPSSVQLLELGAGLALPSAVWAALGGSAIATDRATEDPGRGGGLLELMRRNAADAPAHWTVAALDWSDGEAGLARLPVRGPCIAMACDCVYEPLYGAAARSSLATVVEALLLLGRGRDDDRSRTRGGSGAGFTVVAALLPCERRAGDGIDEFIHDLRASGQLDVASVVTDGPLHVIGVVPARLASGV